MFEQNLSKQMQLLRFRFAKVILSTAVVSVANAMPPTVIACDKCNQSNQTQSCSTCGACNQCSASSSGQRDKPFSILQLSSMVEGFDRFGDALEQSFSRGLRSKPNAWDHTCDSNCDLSKSDALWRDHSPVIGTPYVFGESAGRSSIQSSQQQQPSVSPTRNPLVQNPKPEIQSNASSEQTTQSNDLDSGTRFNSEDTPFTDDRGTIQKPQTLIDSKLPGQLDVPAAKPAEDYQHDPFKDDVRNLKAPSSRPRSINQLQRQTVVENKNQVRSPLGQSANSLKPSVNRNSQREPIRINVGGSSDRKPSLPAVRTAGYEDNAVDAGNAVLPASAIHLPQ